MTLSSSRGSLKNLASDPGSHRTAAQRRRAGERGPSWACACPHPSRAKAAPPHPPPAARVHAATAYSPRDRKAGLGRSTLSKESCPTLCISGGGGAAPEPAERPGGSRRLTCPHLGQPPEPPSLPFRESGVTRGSRYLSGAAPSPSSSMLPSRNMGPQQKLSPSEPPELHWSSPQALLFQRPTWESRAVA